MSLTDYSTSGFGFWVHKRTCHDLPLYFETGWKTAGWGGGIVRLIV